MLRIFFLLLLISFPRSKMILQLKNQHYLNLRCLCVHIFLKLFTNFTFIFQGVVFPASDQLPIQERQRVQADLKANNGEGHHGASEVMH